MNIRILYNANDCGAATTWVVWANAYVILPAKAKGVCFYRRWFVCHCVCLWPR